MSAVIERHIESLAATHALMGAQLEALRFAVQSETPKTPIESDPLPARCNQVDPVRCALQRGEWKDIGNFTAPNKKRCMGCGFEDAMREGVSD